MGGPAREIRRFKYILIWMLGYKPFSFLNLISVFPSFAMFYSCFLSCVYRAMVDEDRPLSTVDQKFVENALDVVKLRFGMFFPSFLFLKKFSSE